MNCKFCSYLNEELTPLINKTVDFRLGVDKVGELDIGVYMEGFEGPVNLELCVMNPYNPNKTLVDVKKRIKYCPFCGKKFKQ